jgi:hypothetical protein
VLTGPFELKRESGWPWGTVDRVRRAACALEWKQM